MYNVGGHRLYMSCAGGGPITVLYVHGWVNDAGYVPHNSGLDIRNLLEDDYRVCLYDRRNVGSSDTVDAIQRPADMLRDMEGVLAAGGVEPPYILMAASFGGLVAHAYLNKHRDDVIGMVLIDTMFPDELALDRFLPRDARFVYYNKDDKCCTLERISQFALIKSLRPHIGKEPAIPAIYLASEHEPRDQNDYESPEYDARILVAQAGYVDRFSPGILRWVDAPHFMEPVVPEVIADAVREVDKLATD
jgi:pimeloyl-ACP methyl ester carboxylesterase